MSSPTPVPSPPPSTPTALHAASLGQQLIAVLERDGSAPALALVQHLVAANGDVNEDIKAVNVFIAEMPTLEPELIRDINMVLFQWELTRFTHFLGNHNLLPTPVAAAPAA